MIGRIVKFALRQRVLVLVFTVGMLAWGVYSFFQLPIEAYPDVMNTQVQVITQWPGHAAEEVEKLITVPLETSLNGVPRVTSLRSRSLFGLSVVYLTFDDGADDYFARAQVLERVGAANLPAGIQPALSPLASATGEIFRYTLVGAPPMQLKEIEDWTLEREFKSVPGVADVTSFGGTTKQYQVQIDPGKLKSYGVTLKNVTDAVAGANANTGGSFIERGSEEFIVRGMGQFHSIQDIENVVVTTRNGTPLRVREVASVRIGYQPRLGKVGWRPGQGGPNTDYDDAVEGIVLLRRGENPDVVLEGIHKKIHDLNNGILPTGVKVVPFIDRTDLVLTTSHTVEKNLVEGMLLVVAVPLFVGLAGTAVAGFGIGLAYSPLSTIVLGLAPPGEEGRASSSLTLFENLGFAIGPGVTGALVAIAERGRLSLASALALGWAMAGVMGLLGSLLAGRLTAQRGETPSMAGCLTPE